MKFGKKAMLLGGAVITLIAAAPLLATLTIDQAYDANFDFDVGVNATGGVSQGFTPTANRLDAVDVFITGNGNNPAMNLPVNIRAGSFDGPILGSSTLAIPASLGATASSPFVAHATFSPFIPLTPGGSYYIQVDPDGGFLGVAASFANRYAGGAGFQGDFTLDGLDWGFRTYFGAPEPPPGIGPPANKDVCKNGGWATFTIPRAFKNQGDCIQFVNTGK
jgi:hypothetical protein